MSRPLRLEFPGALYHVTSRGDRREPIFRDDADRSALLDVLAQALDRFDAGCLAYCLMGNHYHFVLHTRAANLSRLMRHVNGIYTQVFNRRHGLVGHLFQGRFKAILVDREAYLLELCRYVELNPVRAKLAKAPGDWPWSSYRAHTGSVAPPDWLDTAELHSQTLGRGPRHAADRRAAARRYAEHVAAGTEVRLWDEALNRQIYLGDDAFVERMQREHLPPADTPRQGRLADIPRAQRSTPGTWPSWLAAANGDRALALRQAYVQGGLTMTALAAELGLSVARISQLIAQTERVQPRTSRSAVH